MRTYPTEWGRQCAELREAQGMTQQQLADALSGPDASSRCNVASVRDWEQGRSEPPGWVQYLILGAVLRRSLRPLRSARSTARR